MKNLQKTLDYYPTLCYYNEVANFKYAQVAEQADARDLKSRG